MMKNIYESHFRMMCLIKNKVLLKFCIINLLLILLCSCNKNDGNVIKDVEVVNMDDKTSEDITNANIEEALTKVQDEVKSLTGRDDVETSELFSFKNIYYIKVKIHDLMLHYEYIYADSVEDEPTAFTAYTDRDLNNIEKEISGDYYEIWRCENGDLKRILYNMEDVVYSQDDNKIIIDGAYNSYIIKLESDNEGKEKILYECYYTDILSSDNGDFTCYINDIFSICVVDNKSNEIILNKYIDFENEFSKENFKLDNNKVLFPTRFWVMKTGWIKSSNMAYFACGDLSNVFFIIDIDKKIISQPGFTISRGYDGFIDENKGYIVSGYPYYALDTDTYMMDHLEKQYNYLYLINLYTLEKFEIAKSIRTKIEFKKEDDKTLSYTASSGERVTVDISDMIGKDRAHEREEFKDILYSQLSLGEDENINLHKFNDIVYAVVDEGESKMLIQHTKENKVNIVADSLDDINFSELNKYISLYNRNGDIIVLDSSGNKYLEDNVFNYISNNDTGIELGTTVWGKNNDKLYILAKKDDRLSNIFEVNLVNKSIMDLSTDIDCRYENLYIDISEGYVVYSTFPGHIFYLYDKEVNDDVCLYVKYINSGEKVEIARAKGESIYFYIFDNKLNYYCRENNDIEGVYELSVDGLATGKSQEANLSNNMEAKSEYKNETNNEIVYIDSFIPNDWEILKQGDELAIAEGDINNDGIIDKAFVVTEKEKNNSSDYTAQRNLIIVFGNTDGSYDLSITAKNAILLANEGGTFGDPFYGITIDSGSVILKFMGGSVRWGRCFRFRYQDNGWYLIGFTESSYESVGDSMELLQDDYNLITGDFIGDELENGKIKTIEKNIGKKQLLNLNDFIANEYSIQ